MGFVECGVRRGKMLQRVPVPMLVTVRSRLVWSSVGSRRRPKYITAEVQGTNVLPI